MLDVYVGIERTLPLPKWGVTWLKDPDALHLWIFHVEVVISRS